MRKKRRRKSGFGYVVLLIFTIVFISTLVNSFSLEAENAAIVSPTPNPDSYLLVLVNKTNKLPDNYSVDLIEFEGEKINKILADDLIEMQNAAARANVRLEINVANRTKSEQEKTFKNIVSNYVKQGNSQNVALDKAKRLAALPGYSEHQTGLAIDFSFNGDDKAQTQMWDWLAKNAHKYGFILRYPEGKEHITGYDYEPWHYRYVGKKHAENIYKQDLVLEEYLSSDT